MRQLCLQDWLELAVTSKTKNLRRGFSVIEALAAVALLALALAPLYSMLQQITSATLRIERFVEAREVNGTVSSLVQSGMGVPEEIQGWSVTVTMNEPGSEEAVDGYLGGQYFTLLTENYTVTLRKNEYTFERRHSRIALNPIYDSEEEAIFSNM